MAVTTSASPAGTASGTSKDNFTAYKLLFTDIVNGWQVAVPRAIIAADNQSTPVSWASIPNSGARRT